LIPHERSVTNALFVPAPKRSVWCWGVRVCSEASDGHQRKFFNATIFSPLFSKKSGKRKLSEEKNAENRINKFSA